MTAFELYDMTLAAVEVADEVAIVQECRKNIEESELVRAKPDKIGMNEKNILHPSKDWNKIKFFKRVRICCILSQGNTYINLYIAINQ